MPGHDKTKQDLRGADGRDSDESGTDSLVKDNSARDRSVIISADIENLPNSEGRADRHGKRALARGDGSPTESTSRIIGGPNLTD
jgi:hypothetical protein